MLFDRDYMKDEPRRPQRRNAPRYSPSTQSVVKTLIIANIVVYVLQLLLGQRFTNGLVLSPKTIRELQLWRFVTYMFAHSPFSIFHILLNMYGVFLFGSGLERRLGPERFTVLYMVSGLIGGLTWILFNWGNPQAAVLGASGAVFGLLMGAAMMFPDEVIVLLIPPIPMKLKTFALVFGGIEILMSLGHGGGIAHIAHVGGAVGGYVYLMLITRPTWAPFSGVFAALRKALSRRSGPARQRQQFRRQEPDTSPRKEEDDSGSSDEVDRILDKIGQHGLDSLTRQERETLNRARERLRDRRQESDDA